MLSNNDFIEQKPCLKRNFVVCGLIGEENLLTMHESYIVKREILRLDT